MTNTEVIKIAEDLKVDPDDVWNVYLNRNIQIDRVVKARISHKIKQNETN